MKILTNKEYEKLIDKIKLLEEEKEKQQNSLHEMSIYNYELLEDKEKYYKAYKDLKEINEEHLKVNGNLRKELDTQKEKHAKYVKEKQKEIRNYKNSMKVKEK